MKLKVIKYVPSGRYHLCVDRAGKDHRVDLMTDGKIKCPPEKLAGEFVMVDRLDTFLEMAQGVRLLTPEEHAEQERRHRESFPEAVARAKREAKAAKKASE